MSAREALFGYVQAGADEEDLPSFAGALDAYAAEVRAAALREGLTPEERKFLWFALDEAADEMCNQDEFEEPEWEALRSLRRMAEEGKAQ